jgi:hypothetical protein
MPVHLIYCVVWFLFHLFWIQKFIFKMVLKKVCIKNEISKPTLLTFAAWSPRGLHRAGLLPPAPLPPCFGPPSRAACFTLPLSRMWVGPGGIAGTPSFSFVSLMNGSHCQPHHLPPCHNRAGVEPDFHWIHPSNSGFPPKTVTSWGYKSVAASTLFSFSILTLSRMPSTWV